MANSPILHCTVTFARRDHKVLLGRKTEKVGVGLFNAPGGVIEIEKGEEPYDATIRELGEETGLEADPWDVVPVAVVDCHNKRSDGTPWVCRLYVSELYIWRGTPRDSRELVGQQWFPVGALPLGEMLPGDRSWMPLALSGERFVAQVYYGPGLTTLERDTQISLLSRTQLIRSWVLP